MARKDLLNGKKILIVDDEPDVLETLEELLSMCRVIKSTDFEKAKILLENEYFDIAVLDIMGIRGFTLLEIANRKKVMAVMLTAHGFSPENTVRSYKEGAAAYVPKEKINNITTFLNDILEAQELNKNFWWRWLDRLNSLYEKKFGPDWQRHDREFWDKFSSY